MSQQNPNRGPPSNRGPPDHVEERTPDHVHVGKSNHEKRQEQAANVSNQQDRIEAKLDLILEALNE